MYKSEKILSDEVKARTGNPCRDVVTPEIVKAYIKLLVVNALQMYLETGDMDYVVTMQILLKLFRVQNGRAVRRYNAEECSEIMDIIMPELYDEMPPERIADMVRDDLPRIRQETIQDKIKWGHYKMNKIRRGHI